MTNKRKKGRGSRPKTHHDTSGGGGPSNYNNSNNNTYDQTHHHHKRPRYNNNNNNNSTSETALPLDGARHGYIDPHTGQRGAFPGLEDDDGEFYGPANDGMDYLKMVRWVFLSFLVLVLWMLRLTREGRVKVWLADG